MEAMAGMRSVACMIAIAGALAASPAFAAKKYAGGEVGNGGVIRGSVVFNGTMPVLKIVIPEKDRAACGGDREEPALITGPKNGVRDVIVYIKKIGQGKPWARPAKAPWIPAAFTPPWKVQTPILAPAFIRENASARATA